MKQTDLTTHCNIHTEYSLYDFYSGSTHTSVQLCLSSSTKPFLWRTRLSVTLSSTPSPPEGCAGFRPDTLPQTTDILHTRYRRFANLALYTQEEIRTFDPTSFPHRQPPPELQQRLPHPPSAGRAHAPRAPKGDKPDAHGFINDDPTSPKRTDKTLAHARAFKPMAIRKRYRGRATVRWGGKVVEAVVEEVLLHQVSMDMRVGMEQVCTAADR